MPALQRALLSFYRPEPPLEVVGFEELFESSPIALVLTAIDTQRVLLANQRAKDLFEVDSDRGQHVIDFWVDPSERSKVIEAIREHGTIGELHAHLKSASGRAFRAELEAQTVIFEGTPALLVGILDRSRQFELETRLRELAMHDALTGVFNRGHMFTLAETEIARAMRHSHRLSLAMIDVDHFKHVNDVHGHEAGDRVLRSFADACRRELREIDVIGRYGGEEFVVLFVETDRETALLASERVRRMAEQLRIGDIRITISIGVVEWKRGELLSSMLKRADENLYAAKAAGRNTIRSSH